MRKSFIVFLMLCLLGNASLKAQSYTVSSIEKTDKEGMQYEILGKVGDRYWVFKNNDGISTIAQYNAQMLMVKQNDLSFLPKQLNGLEFVTFSDKVFVVYQFQVNTTLYAAAAQLSEEGQLVGTPKILDTAEKIRPASSTKVFNLLQSDDHQKMVLFSVNTTKPSALKVKTLTLNNNFEVIGGSEFSVQSQSKKSALSDFALDNAGNLYCLRNSTQANAAPAVSLIFLSASGAEVVESPVINNSLLLDNIRLTVDNNKNRVLLNSFYATEKKGHVEGLYSYVWDIATRKEVVTNANRFTDAVRWAVAQKRNIKDAFDACYVDRISHQEDGSYVVVAEQAESYVNHNSFSRWDYYYGGAFYNPFMFNYWNRPFGFYPWARMGWGMGWGMNPWMMRPWGNPFAYYGYPSVTYNANKIALLSFDKNGSLQWVKTIDKSQSDQNVDQFIGYGIIKNQEGTQFLYHDKQKGIHFLVINALTAQGQLTKGASIMTSEKNYEWMPRMLKQVGDHEAILPYQYKSKIGFAKVQFK
ncbi:MAG: hypothetical protein EBV82_00480 [Chitinophagia bacterium]|nr:hypothetical protein [Chitinophagia bacterium]